MPKVTAIVPNYNHERFLDRRIRSVLDQTYPDIEVLLLDDASKDGSLQVFEKYRSHPRVKAIVANEQNTGIPFKQWNKGVALASGEYLWFAESDDYADPRLVERLVGKLDALPRVGVAYSESIGVDENERPLYSLGDWTRDLHPDRWNADYVNSGTDECARFVVRKCTIPNASAAIIRKSCYLAVGGADEDFRLSGDWMLWAKLLLVSDVAFVAEPLNHFRMHSNTVRRASARGAIALTEAIRILAHIRSRTAIAPEVYEQVCDRLLDRWVEQLTQGRFALGTNLDIHRRLRGVDPRLTSRIFARLFGKLRRRAG
jgi:cellulose synthase/poly-beta-1,6-N-acetylglucosamine synthase-like glycosyltransferase